MTITPLVGPGKQCLERLLDATDNPFVTGYVARMRKSISICTIFALSG
jgi:hypothetical protein